MNEDFGQERSTANLLLETDDEAEVSAYVDEVEQIDGVLDVRQVDAQDGVTLLRASWAGNSQTQASQDVVVAIRDVPGPGGRTCWLVD